MRPAMYVGLAKIRLVTTLLLGLSWGYAAGKKGNFDYLAIGGGDLWNSFPWYVASKYGINSPGWGMERILLHHNEHDHLKAIKAIPALFEEFLATPLRSDMPKAKEGAAPECEECDGWQI